MDRFLTLESVRLTETAAIYASRLMGKGDADAANKAATEAMLRVIDTMSVDGEIAFGTDTWNDSFTEGKSVGSGVGTPVEFAIKPLDGKKTCARGSHNATSVIAMGSPGSFLRLPHMYMNKIAVGPECKGVVDINEPAHINIKRVARAKEKYIEDITVCVLDRPVNFRLVDEIRETGARIIYIRDGDISGAIATAQENNPIDILMGIGGSQECVLAAAALKSMGGDIQGQFYYNDESEYSMTNPVTGNDPYKIFRIQDMIKSDSVMVAVTGVTDGVLMSGVRYFSGGAETSTVVMRQRTHTIRYIRAQHRFDFKPVF